MDYTAAAIVLFMIMIAGNMLWMAGKITKIEKMLAAILEGGKFVMPKVNDGMQMLQLAVRAGGAIAKRAIEKRRAKKIKNLGQTPVIPDVDDIVLRKFARVLLQEIGQSAGIEDVKLTEAVWIVGGKFKDIVGGSPAQFKACMDRLEQERIVTRSGGKNVRVWAMPYRSITSKLQRLLK